MSNLDYPLFFECYSCATEAIVTRDDARCHYPDPDSPNAVDVVLEERGWVQEKEEGTVLRPVWANGEF